MIKCPPAITDPSRIGDFKPLAREVGKLVRELTGDPSFKGVRELNFFAKLLSYESYSHLQHDIKGKTASSDQRGPIHFACHKCHRDYAQRFIELLSPQHSAPKDSDTLKEVSESLWRIANDYEYENIKFYKDTDKNSSICLAMSSHGPFIDSEADGQGTIGAVYVTVSNGQYTVKTLNTKETWESYSLFGNADNLLKNAGIPVFKEGSSPPSKQHLLNYFSHSKAAMELAKWTSKNRREFTDEAYSSRSVEVLRYCGILNDEEVSEIDNYFERWRVDGNSYIEKHHPGKTLKDISKKERALATLMMGDHEHLKYADFETHIWALVTNKEGSRNIFCIDFENTYGNDEFAIQSEYGGLSRTDCPLELLNQRLPLKPKKGSFYLPESFGISELWLEISEMIRSRAMTINDYCTRFYPGLTLHSNGKTFTFASHSRVTADLAHHELGFTNKKLASIGLRSTFDLHLDDNINISDLAQYTSTQSSTKPFVFVRDIDYDSGDNSVKQISLSSIEIPEPADRKVDIIDAI